METSSVKPVLGVGVLACWGVGVLGCWHVGVLECWGRWLCLCSGLLLNQAPFILQSGGCFKPFALIGSCREGCCSEGWSGREGIRPVSGGPRTCICNKRSGFWAADPQSHLRPWGRITGVIWKMLYMFKKNEIRIIDPSCKQDFPWGSKCRVHRRTREGDWLPLQMKSSPLWG